MRNYDSIDKYYNELMQDIYPQPLDDLHKQWTQEIVDKVCTFLPDCTSVLDVGCGEGYAQELFEHHGVHYYGVSLGEDFETAHKLDKNVGKYDFNFLDGVGNFDLIFSRHTLEHSPFPLLTLMEWHEKARNWLCLVMPNPDHFSYIGRNHYSVAYPRQIRWWLRRAGWRILWRQSTAEEYRCICKKEKRISYEGWAEEPLSNKIYEADRDDV